MCLIRQIGFSETVSTARRTQINHKPILRIHYVTFECTPRFQGTRGSSVTWPRRGSRRHGYACAGACARSVPATGYGSYSFVRRSHRLSVRYNGRSPEKPIDPQSTHWVPYSLFVSILIDHRWGPVICVRREGFVTRETQNATLAKGLRNGSCELIVVIVYQSWLI